MSYYKEDKNIGFSLPSVRRLSMELGRVDAMIEFVECSIRTLLKKGSDIPLNEFLRAESEECGIKLCTSNVDEFMLLARRGYLVHVEACFQVMCENIHEDIKDVTGWEYTIDCDGKTEFEKIKEVFNSRKVKFDVPAYVQDLYLYYHAVRNCVAHTTINDKKVKNKYADVQKHINEIRSRFPNQKSGVPHEANMIDFDDFILFSAAIQIIADGIEKSIVDYIDIECLKKKMIKKIPLDKNFISERKEMWVKQMVKTEFGLDID